MIHCFYQNVHLLDILMKKENKHSKVGFFAHLQKTGYKHIALKFGQLAYSFLYTVFMMYTTGNIFRGMTPAPVHLSCPRKPIYVLSLYKAFLSSHRQQFDTHCR